MADKTFNMTEEDYHAARSDYEGICKECGELRSQTEPDAEGYECYDCGAMAVQGIENALMEGTIELVDEDELEGEDD